jgi:phosphonopyruvate decarboxylase
MLKDMTMKTAQACQVNARNRGDAIVVSTMTGMAEFFKASNGTKTVSSVPLMGGAAGLDLGLALAQPDTQVIVTDGDSSLLMQLGSLATVVDAVPKNYFHCVVSNGMNFEGLANFPMPAAEALSFRDFALAAGYKSSHCFTDEAAFSDAFPAILSSEGPVFIELVTEANPPSIVDGTNRGFQFPPNQFTGMGDEALTLMAELAPK